MTTSPWDELLDEHRALLAHYGRAQARCTPLLQAQARDMERMQAQIVQLRARVIARESALAWEREDRAAALAELPGLPRRRQLARQVDGLVARIHALAREALHWQWRAGVPTHAAGIAGGALDGGGAEGTWSASVPGPAPQGARRAQDEWVQLFSANARMRSVLCIGQDARGALVTQRMVESGDGTMAADPPLQGASALPQDGGAALEASLIAADLVICQTGCVGHNAYWRVQDHCRRTGKPCVLVDQPQVMHFLRTVPPDEVPTRA